MTEDSRHILICDDEPDLREMVGQYLTKRGFRVTLAGDGAALESCLGDAEDIDAIILDINMPGEDGLSILRRLRAERELPIIMLTAAGEAVDRVIGLEMGADDYLGKPVDLRELEARIKAVLRRSQRKDEAVELDGGLPDKVSFYGLTLDFATTRLFGPDGEEIPLTAMEFRLLKVFVEHRGRVLNRDQLLELAHDRGWDPFDRSVDIRISRLRRKIEPNPDKPTVIRTVRGLGYIFKPE
jgi:DNA-binding response OmpR family regulator